MKTRVARSPGFKSLLLNDIPGASPNDGPRAPNGQKLFPFLWSAGFGPALLKQLGALPQLEGDMLIEVEPSPFLLAEVISNPSKVCWGGCCYHKSPLKQKYFSDLISAKASEMETCDSSSAVAEEEAMKEKLAELSRKLQDATQAIPPTPATALPDMAPAAAMHDICAAPLVLESTDSPFLVCATPTSKRAEACSRFSSHALPSNIFLEKAMVQQELCVIESPN